MADSFTLSGLVDKSIYVIRWEQTPRNVALAGIRQMLDAGADIAGIVLARVDVKKHARYGYAGLRAITNIPTLYPTFRPHSGPGGLK